jgi:hypothetical protein
MVQYGGRVNGASTLFAAQMVCRMGHSRAARLANASQPRAPLPALAKQAVAEPDAAQHGSAGHLGVAGQQTHCWGGVDRAFLRGTRKAGLTKKCVRQTNQGRRQSSPRGGQLSDSPLQKSKSVKELKSARVVSYCTPFDCEEAVHGQDAEHNFHLGSGW